MLDFNKIDFAQMFDATILINNVEKAVQASTTYLPEQFRASTQQVNQAVFSLARTTAEGFADLAEVFQTVSKEVAEEAKQAIQKAAKVTV